MELSFRCVNTECVLGLIVIVLVAAGLSMPFFLGVWAASEMGLL